MTTNLINAVCSNSEHTHRVADNYTFCDHTAQYWRTEEQHIAAAAVEEFYAAHENEAFFAQVNYANTPSEERTLDFPDLIEVATIAAGKALS